MFYYWLAGVFILTNCAVTAEEIYFHQVIMPAEEIRGFYPNKLHLKFILCVESLYRQIFQRISKIGNVHLFFSGGAMKTRIIQTPSEIYTLC